MVPAERATQPAGRRGRPGAIEVVVLIALLLAGFGARAWRLSSVGLNHYDEGVYVLSALGVSDPLQPHRLFPTQILISPPLYYSLVGLSYRALGRPSDMTALAVNVTFGTVTVLFVWLIGRAWFGAPAGVAAAALLALNEFHIAFSRAALTDVSFALIFLLALGLMSAAFSRQSVWLSLVAGLAVGLAWNTKYHGWFALAVGAAALVPAAWRQGWSPAACRKPFLLLCLMGLVAVACYAPWVTFIQSEPGGYAALARYQQTYLSPQWFQNLAAQARMQSYLEGPLSRLSLPLAVAAMALATGDSFRSSWKFPAILVATSVASFALGGAGAAFLLTLAAVPRLMRLPGYSGWILLGWLGLWLVAAPWYRPYARLLLPFTIATHLGAGFWLASVLSEPRREMSPRSWWPALAGVTVIALVLVASLRGEDRDLWRPSRTVADAAVAMQSLIPPGERVVVIGEPMLAFYLHLSGRPAFQRLDDVGQLASLSSPAYVVTGVYAHWAPPLRDRITALGGQLVRLRTYPMVPNDIRLLDDFPVARAQAYRSAPDDTFDLALFRFEPNPLRADDRPQ